MPFKVTHLHFRAPDPDVTLKWYVDILGATVVKGNATSGYRIDLHGLPIQISGFKASQKHKQVYGFEHIGIRTDDFPSTVAKLRAAGSEILEEITLSDGRKQYYIDGPQGVMLELVEAPKDDN